MKSVNKVFLIGNVGQVPEIKFTGTGTAVAKFSIATDENFKDKNGEWAEKTEWHNLVAFARLAEIVQQYVKKGSKVFVEGRLQTSNWEDKSTGEKKYKTEIIVNNLLLLGNKAEIPAEESLEITDSDIPF